MGYLIFQLGGEKQNQRRKPKKWELDGHAQFQLEISHWILRSKHN